MAAGVLIFWAVAVKFWQLRPGTVKETIGRGTAVVELHC
jgi:hypothetical protein